MQRWIIIVFTVYLSPCVPFFVLTVETRCDIHIKKFTCWTKGPFPGFALWGLYSESWLAPEGLWCHTILQVRPRVELTIQLINTTTFSFSLGVLHVQSSGLEIQLCFNKRTTADMLEWLSFLMLLFVCSCAPSGKGKRGELLLECACLLLHGPLVVLLLLCHLETLLPFSETSICFLNK